MASLEHIDSLRSKHAQLDRQIGAEMLRPMPDTETLLTLKRQKLRLKEQIAAMTGDLRTEQQPLKH